MVFTIPESDFDTIKRRLAVTAPVADGESRGERRDPFLKRRHAMSTITFRQALLLVWTPISMAARVLFTFTSTALIGLVYFLFMGVSDTVLSSLGTVMHVRYGFSTLHAGLMYLGLGFGCVAAVFLGLPLNDLFVKWRRKRQIRDAKSLRVHVTKRDEGVAEKGDLTDGDMSPVVPDSPLSSSDKRETEVAGQAQGEGTMEKKIMKTTDDEVWFMVTMMPLLPVGMMIYGWTLQSDAHWFVPLIGLFIIGFSFMTILVRLLLPISRHGCAPTLSWQLPPAMMRTYPNLCVTTDRDANILRRGRPRLRWVGTRREHYCAVGRRSTHPASDLVAHRWRWLRSLGGD